MSLWNFKYKFALSGRAALGETKIDKHSAFIIPFDPISTKYSFVLPKWKMSCLNQQMTITLYSSGILPHIDFIFSFPKYVVVDNWDISG